jgi:uncharacterized protein YjbI with pentapeptide repeats
VFTWQQLAISREGQITERFTRAVELLAAYIRNHLPYRPGRRPVTAPTCPSTGDAATDARQEERADRVDCERRFPGLASLQKCAFDIYLALQVLGQRPETLSDGRPFVPSLDTDLRGAQLGSAPLHSADLRGAVLDDLSCWSQGPPFTDLGEALLQGVSLKGARLYGTDLHGAHLEEAKLAGADLSSVDLTDVYLDGATYDARTRFPDGFDPDTHGLLPAR